MIRHYWFTQEFIRTKVTGHTNYVNELTTQVDTFNAWLLLLPRQLAVRKSRF